MLDGARPIRVRVLDSEDRPIMGLKLAPFIFKKSNQPDQLVLSGLADDAVVVTDARGLAVFDWIPRWHDSPITIQPVS